MAAAIAHNRTPRASGAMAMHVLEIMHAVHIAARDEVYVKPQGGGIQPEAMPAGKTVDQWDG